MRAILIENRFRLENGLLLFGALENRAIFECTDENARFFRTCIFESLSVFSIFGSKMVLDKNGPERIEGKSGRRLTR
jgi:hypothetical protein